MCALESFPPCTPLRPAGAHGPQAALTPGRPGEVARSSPTVAMGPEAENRQGAGTAGSWTSPPAPLGAPGLEVTGAPQSLLRPSLPGLPGRLLKVADTHTSFPCPGEYISNQCVHSVSGKDSGWNIPNHHDLGRKGWSHALRPEEPKFYSQGPPALAAGTWLCRAVYLGPQVCVPETQKAQRVHNIAARGG